MHVTVRGARLFFDTEGREWQVAPDALTRRLSLVLLHGERSLAAFRALGGEEAARTARAFFADPRAVFPDYLARCFPLFGRTPPPTGEVERMLLNLEVAHHFVQGEMQRFDLRPALARVRAPTLVLSGGHDVIATSEDVRELLAGLPEDLVTHLHFPESGHEVLRDEASAATAAVSAFCRRITAGSR